MAALELDLRQQISGDSVYLVKLGVRPAERAVIRVLCKPVTLAVGADGFLTDFALEGVLENVVAHPADELGEECCHIRLILDVVLLVHIASVLRGRARRGRGAAEDHRRLCLLLLVDLGIRLLLLLASFHFEI